eukprot:Transcript_29730.p1 GENE.Transcript_29730~~Transcript_29730.p1  ORF type:complete len:432 (+),score=225.75 Transcript_29730:303-1598(+)
MGYFQLSDQGAYTNEYAWNKAAHMLYLESPAGSGQSSGYSSCVQGGEAVPCKWDDVSQAEAYAHSLAAFFKAFPEYKSNDLYLTGESYFGQYGPNIAHWILTHAPFNTSLPLKGIAAGNACWGGDATNVDCNGPNEEKMDIELFHRKALISTKLYAAITKACKWDGAAATVEDAAAQWPGQCEKLQNEAHEAVGPHNVYNLYDNCARGMEAANIPDGISALELKRLLRKRLVPGSQIELEAPSKAATTPERRGLAAAAIDAHGGVSNGSSAVGFSGGYQWSCGGMGATASWITRKDVIKALHLTAGSGSRFGYHSSGPASITLWPFLATKLRVVIYNGDADSCVPYIGNEEWVTSLEDKGILKESEAWRPWYVKKGEGKPPAGYVTSYTVPSAPGKDFAFVTIRLAGHMVPTFQPSPSLAFLSRFLAGEPM